MKTLTSLLLLAASCGGSGHLTESHGRSSRAAFERQTVNRTPRPNAATAAGGLDSHEASAISQSYRQQLTPRAEASGGERLMLIGSPGVGSPPPASSSSTR